jgi:cytochrome P450
MLPFGAVTNTVPSLFWFFAFVMSRPELVARIRAEVEPRVSRSRDGRTATVPLTGLDGHCPILSSAYRETMRLTNHQISTRTALEDTVLADGAGRTYLLKKGVVVQLALATGQRDAAYWGGDVDEFRPERFLGFGDRKDDAAGPGSPRAIRAAFQPFGGGVHLCPGQNFAYAEIMAVMATMVLGYDVSPLSGTDWRLPPYATLSLVDAVNKPAQEGKGFGVRIKRRPGWEGVCWRYEQ